MFVLLQIIKNIFLSCNLMSEIEGEHNEGDIPFHLKNLLCSMRIEIDVELGSRSVITLAYCSSHDHYFLNLLFYLRVTTKQKA